MTRICRKIQPYKCPICGQEMLFFVSSNNTLIDYKRLIIKSSDISELKKYLIIKNVRYIKCITCNKYYLIDWSEHVPVALTDKKCLAKFGL